MKEGRKKCMIRAGDMEDIWNVRREPEIVVILNILKKISVEKDNVVDAMRLVRYHSGDGVICKHPALDGLHCTNAKSKTFGTKILAIASFAINFAFAFAQIR